MNKSEFIKSIATKANLTTKQADAAYDAFLDSIVEAFRDEEKVNLVGFGTFELKKKDAHEAKNPRTGEKVTVAASSTPVFKVGASFKKLFN